VTATLGEGRTPLLPSTGIARRFGLERLSFKLETVNPSGSYKDRFLASEITRLLCRGARACLATSSGNTGSALAAYSARYGLRCLIAVNEQTPAGKLAQMKAHGAVVVRVRGFGASAAATRSVFELLQELAAELDLPLVVSAFAFCPEGMAGVESLGRELLDQTGGEPHHVFVPVGSGGLYIAVCRALGRRWPVHAVQTEGCSTVVAAWERGETLIRPVESTTRISGLSVPFDIDGSAALAELRACGGAGVAVSDAEVYEAQRLLLRLEGIFAEPAGAAALAGLLRLVRQGAFAPETPAVCLVTGSGFKDPDSIAAAAGDGRELLAAVDELPELLRREAAA
jgi:threonine synthase